MIEWLTPQVFDALVIANVVLGLCLAGRRYFSDIRAPLPADAPPSAHDAFNRAQYSRPHSSDA